MPKATILVVDDEALIRWSLTERLKTEEYEVLEADTGRAAMEKLAEGVDLVLLDYRLPDTDGVAVLRKIKEFDPEDRGDRRTGPRDDPSSARSAAVPYECRSPLQPAADSRRLPPDYVAPPSGRDISLRNALYSAGGFKGQV